MSFYEDDLSKWYISANNKHSTFLNQIKNFDLKAQVDTVLDSRKYDNTFDTRFDFDVPDEKKDGIVLRSHNEQFSVWIDDDPNKHKLYRLTPGADSSNVSSNEVKQSSGSSSSNKSSFQPKGYIDGNSHDCVLLEDYKNMKFPTVALSVKEKSPNNYMIFNNGKKEVWIWIGTYVYNKN